MADVMNIYVFTGGRTAERVFNAIATFFHGDSWSSLLFVIGVIALGMTALRFFLSRDHNHLLSYFSANILITALLLTPTVTVRIDDSSVLGGVRMVDNVPIGVAAPASYATTFMYGMARSIDYIFTTPYDQAYSQSGMLFGSKLVRLTNQIGIQNPELKQLWSQYLQNCIRKDITINGKYTWSDFARATDIFEFLRNNHPSPIRRIAMDGAFPTCKEALPRLERLFEEDAKKGITLIPTQSISDVAQNAALVENSIANSYDTFLNIQRSATDILKQNIAVNGIRDGLVDGTAKNNATAAALNYARTNSQMQAQSTFTTMGINAAEWLPIVHSVLILLLVCSSVPVFLMAFIPGMTVRILKGYAGGFFLIALWPMYFTFINMIITYELEAAGAKSTTLLNGMSLMSADPIVAIHMKFAAIAGALMMMVPFIAKASLSGGMAIVGAVSQQIAGTMNSTATRAAGAAASGDISYGVVQADTWQTNTANGNKFDTAYSNQTYGALTQRADGSSVNYLPGGNAVYSAQGTISRGAFDITSGAVQSQALSQSITDAQRAATQASASYNKTAGSVTDQLMSLTHAASQNQSYGSGTQHTMNSSLQDTLIEMDGVVADEAKSQGISQEQAYKKMVDDYIGYSASGGASLGGDFGKFGKGSIGFNANTGTKWTNSESSTDSHRTDRTSRTSSSRQNQFNDAMSALEQFARSDRTENLHGENKQAVSSISEGIKEAKQYAEAYNTSYAREQSYTSALHDTQTGTLALNQNLMPEFQQYLQNRGCDHVEAIMNGNTPAINEEREAYVQAFFEQKYANYNPELKQALDDSDVGHKAHPMKGSNLQQSYQTQANKIEGQSSQQQLTQDELQSKVQTEQQKLFDNETYVDKQETQAHSQKYIEDDLTGIKKGRGLK
ncbi:conjugal transfer mating-pair stabilization protein TraG [Photobacterium damselae]|uniref:conjugal transfer mating-pair stabilization protein TraG n=1 Tax=Photobacterium damselae TaxID=38293 RepID=UPI00406950C2